MFTILKGFEGYHFNSSFGEWEHLCENDWVFCKRFSPTSSQGAPAMLPGKFSVYAEETPEDLREAFELVTLLSESPNLLAIRGKLHNVSTPMPVRRNKKTFNTDIPSRIIAVDVDSIPTSKTMDTTNLEEVGEYVLKLFNLLQPEVFPLDAGFIVHASSSAGIKSGVRAHILFESSEEVTQNQLKYFMFETNKLAKEVLSYEIADMNFYSATQPHYFADPIFEGIADPFSSKSRLFLKEGSTIDLPSNLPTYISRKAEVTETDHEFFTLIEGMQEFPDEVLEAYENVLEATDGMFLRFIPRIFHLSWQHGVSIAWLEKQLLKPLERYINSKYSNRSVEDYINNGRREALRAFIGESKRSVPEKLLGVPISLVDSMSSEEENYLKMTNLPPEGSVTFVKASLGTGKTTAVINWIDKGKIPGRFLAITNTRSLVSSNAEKFKSGMYNKSIDMLNFNMGTHPRMSTTIHSLHKFKNLTDKIDFLFIDEADAVMNDLLFSPLIRHRRECIQTLYDIMMSAEYIILSDGDISEETIEAYGRLIDFNKPINAVVHERKMLSNAQAYEFIDEKSIWVALKSCLEIGETCILVSDCSPDELNEGAMSLRDATGCVIKEVHSSSTEDEDIRRILDFTNKELKEQKIDALLCSPSVTSGVDFSFFDNVFVITRTNNHTPNMRFQAARRDRGAQSIFYFTSKMTEGFQAGSEHYLIEEGWLEKCQQLFAKRREQESRHFRNTFRYYLMSQGCKIKVITESWGSLDKAEDSYLLQKIDAILESTPEYAPPRHNDAYSLKEQVVQYYHLEGMSDVCFEYVKAYLVDKPSKCAEFFHKLYKNFWPSIKTSGSTTFEFMEAIKNNKAKFYLDTGKNANPRFAKMYLAQAGIKAPGEFTNIIDWYRTYCKINNFEIPEEFLDAEELENRMEGVLELYV